MKKIEKNNLVDLLKKYQRGRCSAGEIQLLGKWLDKMEEITVDDQIFNSASEIINIENRIWQFIKKRNLNRSRAVKLWPILRYAATIAVLLALYYFIAMPGKNSLIAVADWDTITTGQEMKEVQLADGSVVWLNTGTTICYPSEFNNHKQRIVKLVNGEALFDVAHDSLRLFNVISNKIKIVVLGTRFMVTDFAALNEAKVTVERGKVRVKHHWHKLAELTKEQAIKYNKETKEILYNENHSWFDPKKRTILLDDCPFEEFAIRMESIYGINLHAANREATNYRFTGEIFLDEALEITLYKFCAIHGGGCTQKGKEVFME